MCFLPIIGLERVELSLPDSESSILRPIDYSPICQTVITLLSGRRSATELRSQLAMVPLQQLCGVEPRLPANLVNVYVRIHIRPAPSWYAPIRLWTGYRDLWTNHWEPREGSVSCCRSLPDRNKQLISTCNPAKVTLDCCLTALTCGQLGKPINVCFTQSTSRFLTTHWERRIIF